MHAVNSDGLQAKLLSQQPTDDDGAIQIEAFLSAQDTPSFNSATSCLPTGSAHLRSMS